LVKEEVLNVYPQIKKYKEVLNGKRAAIYVGGAFKVFSLIKALKQIGWM